MSLCEQTGIMIYLENDGRLERAFVIIADWRAPALQAFLE